MTLLNDFRGQLSWGRVSSAVALVVAVVGQWHGMTAESTAVWLGAACGNYSASKVTEMVCGRGQA